MTWRTPRTAVSAVLLILLASLGLAGLAGAAPAGDTFTQNVAAGDYQATPVVPADQRFTVGVFSVTRSAGKRQIVPSAYYAGIFYPDDGECDDLEVPLTATRIPISSTGRFLISDRTRVQDGYVDVTWKGHWSAPGVVAGTIVIKDDAECSSTGKWTGGKVG